METENSSHIGAFIIDGVKFLKLKERWLVEELNEHKMWLPSKHNYSQYLPDYPTLTDNQRDKLAKTIKKFRWK